MLITWELIVLFATWVLGWSIVAVMLFGKVNQRFWFRIIIALVIIHLVMQVELMNFLLEPDHQWIGFVLSIPLFALMIYNLLKSNKTKQRS